MMGGGGDYRESSGERLARARSPRFELDGDLRGRVRERLHLWAGEPSGVEYLVEEGHPAVEIARVADDRNSDLIVMSNAGRTAAERLLVGSVRVSLGQCTGPDDATRKPRSVGSTSCTRFRNSRLKPSTKNRTSTETSPARSRNGGNFTGSTSRRQKRSSRNVPSRAFASRSWLVAAMMRTSTPMSAAPPAPSPRSRQVLRDVGCDSCHGGNPDTFESLRAHRGVLSSFNPSSPVHRTQLPATCGACHVGPYVNFQASRHRQDAATA